MLRNPEDMPSACYLPSHPPGKRQGRQAHCAAMPQELGGRLCGPGGVGAGRLSGALGLGCTRLGGQCSSSARVASTLGLGAQEAPPETRPAAAGGVGSPPVPGPRGPWGRGGDTQDAVTGRPGACGGGTGRQYWPLTRGAPREGLSFGQHARSKCARKVTEPTDRAMGTCRRGRKAGGPARGEGPSSRVGRPPLGSAATCRGWGDKSGPSWVRGCPGKHGSSGGRGGTRLPMGLKRTMATERP